MFKLDSSYRAQFVEYATGFGVMYEKDGLYGLVDKTGKAITDAEYQKLTTEDISRNSTGEYVIAKKSMTECGLLDPEGNLVVPCEYADCSVLSDGFALGITLEESTEDDFDIYSSDHLTFTSEDATGYYFGYYNVVNMSTQEASPLKKRKNDGEFVMATDALQYFVNQDDTLNVYNFAGEQQLSDKNLTYLGEQYFQDDDGNVYDGTGSVAFQYNILSTLIKSYSEGYFNCSTGYMNETGNMISEEVYDTQYDFVNGMALVAKDGKKGFFDQTGELLGEMVEFDAEADLVNMMGDYLRKSTSDSVESWLFPGKTQWAEYGEGVNACGEIINDYYNGKLYDADGEEVISGENINCNTTGTYVMIQDQNSNSHVYEVVEK